MTKEDMYSVLNFMHSSIIQALQTLLNADGDILT